MAVPDVYLDASGIALGKQPDLYAVLGIDESELLSGDSLRPG